MTTVTIPKEFQKEEKLIAFPKRLYEEFLAAQKALKSRRTFMPTKAELRLIERGRREFKQGKFVSLDEI